MIKRSFDALFAFSWLILMSPLILLIAILIRIDSPGPILYVPQMMGRKGELFHLLRFRTMYVNDLGGLDQRRGFTRIGRFIRNYSLDHLPTLVNVLKGDLSIIGPRPMEAEYVDLQDPAWQRYFQVRPGLFNYAVLKLGKTFGPSRASNLSLKRELELEYIQNQSFAHDLRLHLKYVSAHIASGGNVKSRGEPAPEVTKGENVG